MGTTRLTVESLAAGGRGVARHTGRVWFVRGAVPGDEVEAIATRVRPRYVEAEVERLLHPSPARRAAPCAYQEACGGCPWMVLGEKEQRNWKVRLLRDALERLGGVSTVEIEPPRDPVSPTGYRDRVELSVGEGTDGEPVLGFRGAGPAHGLVEVDRCLLQAEPANRVLALVREHVRSVRPELREAMARGGAYRVLIRRSAATGDVVVALRETGPPFPGVDTLAGRLLDPAAGVRGVVRLRGRAGRRGGAETIPVAGREWIDERIGPYELRLPPGSFTQVGAAGAWALAETVIECAGEAAGLPVLDLYGGVGLFGRALLDRGAREALVVDADRDAIECGRASARRAGVRRIRLRHGDVGRALEGLPRGAPELVVANPPRTGFGKGVAAAIAARQPARIVLVSCDPPTLARDTRALAGAGYRLRRVVPLDLFPQTAHLETVVDLTA